MYISIACWFERVKSAWKIVKFIVLHVPKMVELVCLPYRDNCIMTDSIPVYASREAQLEAEWSEKNGVPFEEVTVGSSKKYYWVCAGGHEWVTTMKSRTRMNTNCPYCSNQRVLSGFNDLASQYPELVSEWSVKNVLEPTEVTPGSRKKVGWVCVEGHEWSTTIHARVSGSGCPSCSGRDVILGKTDFASQYPAVASEWHPTKNSLEPTEVKSRTNKKVWWQCDKGHEWETTIISRADGSKCPYCSERLVIPGTNDAGTVTPSLRGEFHVSKNPGLRLDDLSPFSNRHVWWQCNRGHEWEAAISWRTSGSGCPSCSNRRVVVGYNDLVTSHPHLVQEWDFSKNLLTPREVTYGADEMVWWLCKNNHSYEAVLYSRTSSTPSGCPYCSKGKVIPNVTDLVATNPKLAEEWHPTSNGHLTPGQVSAGSNRKVWWRCEKNHEWEAVIANRARKISPVGCPACSKAGVSKAEQEIVDYLEGLSQKVVKNSRSIIAPYELDIYIPEKNLAVEFNGLYWHTESQGKGKWYHHDKWKACKDKGIQLIQVWEDDYTRDPELVKMMLAHKLGVAVTGKVYARQCKIVQLGKTETDVFLKSYHIQGAVDGGLRFGLEHAGLLVAVMVMKNEPGTDGKVLNLLRFATSSQVTGGFTKLLRGVFKSHPGVSGVITFSDNSVSDGGLYENHGFVADKYLPPDYMYLVGRERKHKFGYRLKRFRNDPELKYEEGLTERQLAELNGLERIWDAGKVKWVMKVNSEFAGEDVVDSGEEPLEG